MVPLSGLINVGSRDFKSDVPVVGWGWDPSSPPSGSHNPTPGETV